jgi:uncharacterized 2Fe-2S/4Fe-4S cluster protein (DUF4445 family)
VAQLGTAPYQPATTEAVAVPADQVGLQVGAETLLWIPPAVAGFVGADHLGLVLATGFHRERRVVAAMDIGTNTEVSLATGERILCCSTASGPAFEGARISCGMRAARGAVERIRVAGREWRLTMDATAALRREGLLDPRGGLAAGGDGRLGRDEGGPRFALVPPAMTGHGRPISFTRKDIQEVQVAKAAMRAGLDLLLQETSLAEDEIQRFLVAGAFGTYLDLQSAQAIGLLPPLPLDRFVQVGNAAGAGARLLLFDSWREESEKLAEWMEYVELAGTDRFNEAFTNRLRLP